MAIAKCPECSADLGGQPQCPNCGKPASPDVCALPRVEESSPESNEKAPEQRQHDQRQGEAIKESPEQRHLSAGPPAQVDETDNQTGSVERELVDSGPEPNNAPAQANADERKEKDGEDPASQAQKLKQVKMKKSLLAIQRDGGIIINKVEALLPKTEDLKPLIEFTTPLPRKKWNLPELVLDELSDNLKKLKEKRLILISCVDEVFANAAAYAVVEQLDVADEEQRRLLSFHGNSDESSVPSIFPLKREPEAEKQTVIVVEAVSQKAKIFIESLIELPSLSSFSLTEQLERNGILMLCLVKAKYVEDKLKEINGEQKLNEDSNFTHWEIPFLPLLLKYHFPNQWEELKKKLEEQHQRGLWGGDDDSRFCAEINRSIKSRTLQAEIESNERSPEPAPGRELFSELFKGDNPIQDTVLYVATFFQHLNPHEFIQVVSCLLGSQTMTVVVPATKQNDDGTSTTVEIQKERALAQLWQEAPDSIMRKCRLVTVPVKDSAKAVVFQDSRMGKGLKDYLEREFPLFLESQFQCLQKLGLLFGTSVKLAENIIRLCADMAAAYPDYYGRDWLLEIIRELEQFLESPDDSLSSTETSMFQCLGGLSPFKARAHAYRRITDVLRRMLDKHQLNEAVDELLGQLISTKFYSPALEIIKKLQVGQKIDGLYWLRQLLDRGDEVIRHEAYSYLYAYMKNMGPGIYQVLTALESWLPQEGRPAQTYSHSNRCALSLFIAYCSETTVRFNRKYYGSWPSPYPLFAVKDARAADSNFKLLTMWLFHPGLERVFDEQDVARSSAPGDNHLNTLISSLIAEWMFILRGHNEETAGGRAENSTKGRQRSAADVPRASRSESQPDALTISKLLLKEVAEATTRTQQKEMLAYWELLNQELRQFADLLPYDEALRKELIWKRHLIRDLILCFKESSRRARDLQRQIVQA